MLDALVAEASQDENVIGVVVFGSRGKGAFVTEASDWDVFVVVHEVRGDRPLRHGDVLETVEVTLDQLRNPPEWNRYALTWLRPQLDKTGDIADALREATTVDPATAAEPLDGYVNLYYRSAKNARLGLELASFLDAQESVPWYLQFVFAVHGRARPYNKWLEWELREHPLPVDVDLPRLERIARTGDLDDQRALFRETETLARTLGHAATIDGWEPDVPFLRGQ